MNSKETIEEAAERLYPINTSHKTMGMLNRDQLNNSLKQEGFIEGYKLAKQKMYSEEDIRKMYNWSCGLIGLGQLPDQTENNKRFVELLEQFKKK